MAENGNGTFVRVIFWTLICTSFGWTATTFFIGNKKADAIEQCSIARDTDERKERELLTKDLVRVDTNQVAVLKNVEKILDNQANMVKTLTRLETKLEKIQ
jgi:hypothetical protein